jgi:hypothetical protein
VKAAPGRVHLIRFNHAARRRASDCLLALSSPVLPPPLHLPLALSRSRAVPIYQVPTA